MKYMDKDEFAKVNTYGLGQPNTVYAKFLSGNPS